MFGILKRRRRNGLRARPFPPEWHAVLKRSFPLFTKLPKADQEELQGHIQVFVAEKNFEGCGGLKITDEMKVVIAAQACLLLLHRPTDYYPRLQSILVYPSSYMAKDREATGHGVITERDHGRLGESWQTGAVVLAWDATLGGACGINDGQNVVFHEFAHQLDQEDGDADGAPLLQHRTQYAQWARVLGAEFEQLCRDAESERRTLLDHYGAKNPAEFFAVATECFFEKPAKLREKHPELYEQLKHFYQQDPCEAFGKCASTE